MAYINDKSLVFSDVTDFNLTHIFECGQAFRWEFLETQEDGVIRYTGIASKYPAIISFIPEDNERKGTLYIHIPNDKKPGKPEAAEKPEAMEKPETTEKQSKFRKVGQQADLLTSRSEDPRLTTAERGQARSQGLLFNDDHSLEERSFWEHYLDLKRDYAKIKEYLSKNDHTMRTAISFGEGIRILNQDPWETLISFIISQNNHIPRIKACIEVLCAEFGEPVGGGVVKNLDNGFTSGINPASIAAQTAPNGEYGVITSEIEAKLKKYAFPRIETLASLKATDLGKCRLGYRADYIIAAARRILDEGGVDYLNSLRDMPIDKAEKELLAIKGVGPKVAACVLLFGLGHFEGFPIDVWIRKAMNELYGTDISGNNAQTYALKSFGAYAGIAQQYLFYYMRKKAGK